MKAIFRVENRFGCRDYDTLSEAKKNSTNDEYIKFSFESTDFSRVKRIYANKSWAKKCSEKYDLDFDE